MMKKKKIILLFVVMIGLYACDNVETNYSLAYLYLGHETGRNFFTQGDVNLVADENENVYNTGNDHVEFAFVKDYVYRLNMINKLPKEGWTDTIQHINLQDGYVGRLLLDDGSYEYCRFFVFTENFDANADKYLLFKYQSPVFQEQ
jgi:hypothetical protein